MSIVSDPLGRVLGNRYRLAVVLGSGACAEVFLAIDSVLERRVAVKVLLPALARDASFLQRFWAEARVVAAMNHPHVLRVFDWGEDQDGPYLVLEYLEGGSLLDMLQAGSRLTPAQAAQIGAQAAQGLAYAHARGIVHRDVKPANILFDDEGRVRVADFVVARVTGNVSLGDAATTAAAARYASPEQAQGHAVDGRSDVYSLALVLYEAVTGLVPFGGDAPVRMLRARIEAPLPKHPALGPIAGALSWAAAPDQRARPDAAALALRLGVLADDLSPVDSLPLVRRVNADDAPLGRLDAGMDAATRRGRTAGRDDTLVAPAPGPLIPTADDATLVGTLAADGNGAESRAGDTTLVAGRADTTLAGTSVPDATLVGRAVVGGGLHTGEPTGVLDVAAIAAAGGTGASGGVAVRSRRRRPKRWPWVALIVLVVACLVAAGALYAVKKKLFTPSHRLPQLVGERVSTAEAILEGDHFRVVVEPGITTTKVAQGDIVSQTPPKGVSLKQGSTVQIVPSSGLPTETVPTLAGDIGCATADQLLSENHLSADCPAQQEYSKTVPNGIVIDWSYEGKLNPTSAPYGATIAVVVSEGKPPATIPSLIGEPYTQAAATLRADGVVPQEMQGYSTTVAAGDVISTTPPAGATVTNGSTVTVTVSEGAHTVAVPDVVTHDLKTATAAIQAAGLTAAVNPGTPTTTTAVVTSETPPAGTKVKGGTTVTLHTKKAKGAAGGGNVPNEAAGTGTGTLFF